MIGADIRLTLRLTGEYVRLSVSDTGCGMSSEVQEHIFKHVFTTKEEGRERDLGCRPCWASSREAGGLDVVSESGVGTRFDKYLSRIVREIEVPEDENVLLMWVWRPVIQPVPTSRSPVHPRRWQARWVSFWI